MVPVKSHFGSTMLHRFSKAVLLFVFSAAFVVTTRPADDPATQLKRNFESAKSALSAGDLSEAERHYNQVIALGLRQLANLSLSESSFDQAARELDQAMKFAPSDPDVAVDAAVAWFRAGDVKKARQLAQTVAHSNPRNARAQNVLGRIDLYRGDFPAAIGDLQAAIALDDDFETSYFLGIAYLRAKHFTDAQQWFKHLQDTMGDSAALHVLFGRAYSIGHFPESAVAEFRKAIQLDPKYPHAHGLLGYSILEFRGEEVYPQACLEFERELKLYPDDYNALLLLGISAVAGYVPSKGSMLDGSLSGAALLACARALGAVSGVGELMPPVNGRASASTTRLAMSSCRPNRSPSDAWTMCDVSSVPPGLEIGSAAWKKRRRRS